MLRRSLGALSVAAVILSGVCSAQKPKTGGGNDIQLNGTVEQVVPQGILVQGKDGKKYAVGFNNASKVGLVGNASVDFIMPGKYVQFSVDLNEKGEPTNEVKKIQITEPSTLNEPGIFSEAGPGSKPGAAGKYFIRGTVTANKTDTLSVRAGQKTMTVKIAAGTTVPVTIGEWQLAQPGDAVSGSGKSFVQPGAPMTMVLGEKIEIKAAQPLTKKKGKK